jgi:hypothetical protein
MNRLINGVLHDYPVSMPTLAMDSAATPALDADTEIDLEFDEEELPK